MDRCNECWLQKLKDTKDRPYICARCEFIYRCEMLKRALSETWGGKFSLGLFDNMDRALKRIYDFIHRKNDKEGK